MKPGLVLRPGGYEPARQAPRKLFSCKGRGKVDPGQDRVGLKFLKCLGIANDRYGARAFFTLKGYASRNRETELASLRRTSSHRRSSRLNGKKADAKQNLGFSRVYVAEDAAARRQPEGPARGCPNEVAGSG